MTHETTQRPATAYERAVEATRQINLLIEALENQIPTGQRDKTGLHWTFDNKNPLGELQFHTELYHGYYGNSSVSRDDPPGIGHEIAKTLTELRQEIVARTKARLLKELAATREEARKEAEMVLTEVSS